MPFSGLKALFIFLFTYISRHFYINKSLKTKINMTNSFSKGIFSYRIMLMNQW